MADVPAEGSVSQCFTEPLTFGFPKVIYFRDVIREFKKKKENYLTVKNFTSFLSTIFLVRK